MSGKHHAADWICLDCKDPGRKYFSNNLCARCWQRALRRRREKHPAFNWKGYHCDKCGAVPVKARGLCAHCYANKLNKTSSRAMRNRYLANQRKHFGGRRETLLSMLGGKCQGCGLADEQSINQFGRKLDIHHKDGNGRTSSQPNHADENLMLLCPPCHRRIHIAMKKKVAS
jgi:hypothetical protein